MKSSVFARGLLVVTILSLSAALRAEETKFIVGQHGKQFNNITIESVTDLETIVTTSNDINGEVNWDQAAKTGSAKLSVAVTSLKTGIETRDGHLQGEGWLNAAKFPNITFETASVKAGEGGTYNVTGKFTMKGVTKDVTSTATVKYLPHKKELDEVMPDANFVKVTTAFDLKLSDFGIKLEVIGLKVADTLKIKVSMLGVQPLK